MARSTAVVLLTAWVLVAGVQASAAGLTTEHKQGHRGLKSWLWKKQSGPGSDGSYSIFRPIVVLLGDSITEFGSNEGGWHQQLTRDYTRKADVINRGFGGYNSRWGTYLIDDIINSFGAGRIKLVTICFGANDAVAPDAPLGYLHVPVEEYADNLRVMVSKLKTAGVSNIIMLAPPPVDDVYHFKDGARSNKRLVAYAEAASAVAKEAGLPFVDLFHQMQAYPDWRKTIMDYDGLHMAREGQTFIHNHVIQAITDSFPLLAPRRLPLHFPAYNRVNAANPEDTFDAMYGYKVDRGLPKDPAPKDPAAPAPTTAPAATPAAAPAAAPAAPPAAAPAAVPATVPAPVPATMPATAPATAPAANVAAPSVVAGSGNDRNAAPATAVPALNVAPAVPSGSSKGSEGKGVATSGKGDTAQTKFYNTGSSMGRRMWQ